ncbi:MAG TPA: squalene synthase HpnC, partial [Solibacterales bacterium]|nr:squalene synthase HpnC [Bryobacterales bacterium]
YRDEERQRLSDATCTALQLANFWQDVTVDLEKNRVYLPQHLFTLHGYSEDQLFARQFNPAFRLVMTDAVATAQDLFEQGLPLARMLDRRLALDIDLFSRGGLKVLEKIRAQDYNVLRARPAISKLERISLLLRSLVRVTLAA